MTDVRNWEEFEEELKSLPPAALLFRGQEDSCWGLTTTLDRSRQEGTKITASGGTSVPRARRLLLGPHYNAGPKQARRDENH